MTVRDEYEVLLQDDGTLDTVIEVHHARWAEPKTYRYDLEFASKYRDESGCLDLIAFAQEVVIPDAESEE